jgi:hypothetical protein
MNSITSYPTLDELALETSTDRSSRYHSYTDTYDELFSHLRYKPVTLLEQGILSGDGLKMWNKYFTNPKARIYGLDFENKWQPTEDDEHRITTFLGNQRDIVFLSQVVEITGPLDICIDDAGHFYTDQVPAFEFLWPFVKPGGFYTCEDIHTSWHPQHSEGGRIIDFFTNIAADIQDHGQTWHGKPLVTDKWYSVEWIMFRKGMVILKKRLSSEE